MKWPLLCLLAIAAPLCASAQTQGMALYEQPISYTRGKMKLYPNAPTDPTLKSGIVFNIEIRPMGTNTDPGWFQFTSYEDYRGLLLTLSAEQTYYVSQMQVFSPMDIWLLDAYGTIVQVIPGIVLAELQEAIPSPSPVVAVFFTKGGTSESLGIRPGDMVEYSLFKKRPTVLSQPPAPVPEEPPAPIKVDPSLTAPGGVDNINPPRSEELMDEILKKHRQE